ncbi:MAG: tRNA pseudouridine(13) synthase TruD [Anaerolineae bacterium]|nr:tRNA pseudouridine(13) synthase TruD [Anaerolineae bacterium]
MRLKVVPEDFIVEEVLRPLEGKGEGKSGGPCVLYRVQKRATTTLEVQARMARALRLPRSAVSFPALKDRDAVAVQYATVRAGALRAPARIEGPGFVAERIGSLPHPLSPADLAGNRFAITVRDLSREEAEALGQRLERAAAEGIPNYFDEQRFGSRTAAGDFPGRRILLRDAEGALRAHLAEPQAGDPPQVRVFKQEVAQHWGDWHYLLNIAPRPSNFRSVLTFLCDHPTDFRRALNLVTPRLLSLYLAAYQSRLWNRIAARYLTVLLGNPEEFLEIAGEPLPLFSGMASRLPAGLAVLLPHHQARYEEPLLAKIVADVLAAEGLTVSDLKPRLLERAYLSRGERALGLFPKDSEASEPLPDERFPGRWSVRLRFTLPPGSYGTLVIKALKRIA